MKILYLGYYDYPYKGGAYIIEDNKFIGQIISDEDIEDFEFLIFALYEFIPEFGEDKPYTRKNCEDKRKKLDKYFKEFDRIIACEDGKFYVLK